MADFPLVPTRTALINVDMQDCFVEGSPLSSPDGLVVLQRINQLAQACRRRGDPRRPHPRLDAPDGSNLGVMGELVPPFIVALYTEGSPTAELHHGLDVDTTDVVLNKPRYGAFHGTDLEIDPALPRHRHGDHLGGIATNICCETTAREAAQRDFRVSSSATAPPPRTCTASPPPTCSGRPARASAWSSPRS